MKLIHWLSADKSKCPDCDFWDLCDGGMMESDQYFFLIIGLIGIGYCPGYFV